MIDREKRSRTLIEVKLVENISKNLQNFLEKYLVKKEVFHSQQNITVTEHNITEYNSLLHLMCMIAQALPSI